MLIPSRQPQASRAKAQEQSVYRCWNRMDVAPATCCLPHLLFVRQDRTAFEDPSQSCLLSLMKTESEFIDFSKCLCCHFIVCAPADHKHAQFIVKRPICFFRTFVSPRGLYDHRDLPRIVQCIPFLLFFLSTFGKTEFGVLESLYIFTFCFHQRAARIKS